MKFKEFLLMEDVIPTIDDSDVITTLDNYNITYTRTKDDNDNDLMYVFDNRFSLKYDGSTFTLYRSENKIHMMNARNKNEIDKAISSWTDSYELASAETNSEEPVDNEYDVDTDTAGRTDVTDDNVEDVVQKMKDDAKNKEANNEDDFYTKLNKENDK